MLRGGYFQREDIIHTYGQLGNVIAHSSAHGHNVAARWHVLRLCFTSPPSQSGGRDVRLFR
eukprot:6208521-Pleurochrysis_carterae.AAC.1